MEFSLLAQKLNLALAFVVVTSSYAPADSLEHSSRAVVHLLDYLAQDYGGAVANGKITSQSEYKEQIEFSETAAEINKNLNETKGHPEIQSRLEKLKNLIAKRAGADEVARLAQQVKSGIIKVSGLEVAP